MKRLATLALAALTFTTVVGCSTTEARQPVAASVTCELEQGYDLMWEEPCEVTQGSDGAFNIISASGAARPNNWSVYPIAGSEELYRNGELCTGVPLITVHSDITMSASCLENDPSKTWSVNFPL